jgi:hypothetical protein
VSKPWKQRNVRDLQAEAQAVGVRLVHCGKIPLHGKFLAWDENDLAITSVNWASASKQMITRNGPSFCMASSFAGGHERQVKFGTAILLPLLDIFI